MFSTCGCALRGLQHTDMPHEMSSEALEMVVGAVDKYFTSENFEVSGLSATRRSNTCHAMMCTSLTLTVMIDLLTAHLLRSANGQSQKAAQMIKENMDKRYGPTWHCVIGEGFGFEVTYEARQMLYMQYQEKIAILVYKC